MSWKEIKALREKRSALLADAHKLVADAAKESRSLNAEENGKFDTIHADASNIGKDIARLEALDAEIREDSEQRSKVGRDSVERASLSTDAKFDEKELRSKWLRGTLSAGEMATLESRALAKGSLILGPRELDPNVVKSYASFAGVLQAGARVVKTENGNAYSIPTINDTSNSGAIYAEAATIAVNQDPTIANKTLNAYKYSSTIVKVSREMLDDTAFDLEGWVLSLCEERIGRRFNTDTTTGDGSSKATGFTDGTLGAATGKTATAVADIVYGEAIDLMYSVDQVHRAKGVFMGEGATLAHLRKLVDDNGAPIWHPNHNGDFDMLFNKRMVENDAMASLGASAKTLAFGNFGAYVVRETGAPYIGRIDQLYAGTDEVGFVVHRRLDGILTDVNAVKLLVMAAS